MSLFLSCFQNETALHVACEKGLVHLVQVLLSNGANPNTQTSAQLNTLTLDDEEQIPVTKQTPLHLAILSKREDIVDVFLQHKGSTTKVLSVFIINFYFVILLLILLVVFFFSLKWS